MKEIGKFQWYRRNNVRNSIDTTRYKENLFVYANVISFDKPLNVRKKNIS